MRGTPCFLIVMLVASCGDDDSDPGTDAAVDAGGDGEPDGGADAGLDAGADAGPACGLLARTVVVSGLSDPVYATAPPGDDRIFVVERLTGRVVIVSDDDVLEAPFLDVAAEISIEGFEAGLLSLAFDPAYETSRRVYVSYTTPDATLRVSRFLVPANTPDAVDPTSEATVIEIPTPEHHNVAGMLEFGPDGLLYIATGDNSDADNAQDLGSLNAKILRIDVASGPGPYEVPADNPFVDTPGARPEVWAFGLREPYRFSFDEASDGIFIADVGENEWEEIDILAPADASGANFGWPIMEGTECYTPREGCDSAGLTMPAYEYAHQDGVAVIGGTVYHGAGLDPCWQGRYFFGDYQAGWIGSLRWNAAEGVTEVEQHDEILGRSFVSLGVDGQGELLIVGANGALDRIIAPD